MQAHNLIIVSLRKFIWSIKNHKPLQLVHSSSFASHSTQRKQPILARGGFKLQPNKVYSLHLTAFWSDYGLCAIGHCGGSLFCNGLGGTPPATLVEITLGNEQDLYDVSLVDGYNLAILITPIKGSGKYSYAGCVSDLNMMCPVGLQVQSHDNRRVVAYESACFAFNLPRYCCTGSFGSPQACKSKLYDDPTSISTCSGGNYLVKFYPHHL